MYAELNKESIMMIPRVVLDILQYRMLGIPKLEYSNNKKIAKQIIKDNSKDISIAGKTHFTYMWITDLAVSFKGAQTVLPYSYLEKQLQRILDESFMLGYVPTCFSKTHSFNMPFERQDNFPCLIHSLYHLKNNPDYDETNKKEKQNICNIDKIKTLYKKYMGKYYDFNNNLLQKDAIHDWMDTIKRPSSTFSNLFLLNMLKQYEELTGEKTPYESCENALFKKRWNGNFFIDYDSSGDYLCADANVPVLYFNLFSKDIQNKIHKSIESSELLYPIPMKTREGEYECTFISSLWARNYHSLIWPHLGLMYLNGLKKMNLPYKNHLKRLDEHLQHYKNFLEVLHMNGTPFSTPFFVTEHSFSMAAGQYLELVAV